MKPLNRKHIPSPVLPIKVLQFGGGNFLRAFIGYMIDRFNQKTNSDLGIAVIKTTAEGNYNDWKAQDGLYHVRTRGIQEGELIADIDLVTAVSSIIHLYEEWDNYLALARSASVQFIFSNTTEGGLMISEEDKSTDTPPISFPAKLTVWLHERFRHFQGDEKMGCIIMPCELLIDNGALLKNLILTTAKKWQLSIDFIQWIETANTFCNTLVDRIVPGVQRTQLPEIWEDIGYQDNMFTEGEPYHLFAIEAPESVATTLPLHEIGLNVVYTDNLAPFRQRKVSILNGAHTGIVPVAYLYGIRIVRDAVEDDLTGTFLLRMIEEEILPTLDMPPSELRKYMTSVIDRFKNPYINHYLINIALNSFSKFKARLLPTIQAYYRIYHQAPPLISFSFACTILFYRGLFDGEHIPLNDDPAVLHLMKTLWEKHPDDYEIIVHQVLSWSAFWGEDLTNYQGFSGLIAAYLQLIEDFGMEYNLNMVLAEEESLE